MFAMITIFYVFLIAFMQAFNIIVFMLIIWILAYFLFLFFFLIIDTSIDNDAKLIYRHLGFATYSIMFGGLIGVLFYEYLTSQTK